jgi:hypothetical protein
VRLAYLALMFVLFLELAVFIPMESFAMPQSAHEINYGITPYQDLAPFLIMSGIFMTVLFWYYKASNVGKYEGFSMRCTKCGRLTRGLKCVICEARK